MYYYKVWDDFDGDYSDGIVMSSQKLSDEQFTTLAKSVRDKLFPGASYVDPRNRMRAVANVLVKEHGFEKIPIRGTCFLDYK